MRDINRESSNNQNFSYCFEIILTSGNMIYLTSSSRAIKNEDIIYYTYSGLNLSQAFFNDSAKDHILLEGIFEEKGINKKTNLLGAEIKILMFFNNNFHNHVTYLCTSYTRYDLSFLIKLEPETVKYNQSIIKKYSKTCRARFGDDQCRVDKGVYSTEVQILEITGQNIIVSDLTQESGYFIGGDAYIKATNFYAKIQHHLHNQIKLDKAPQSVDDKAYKTIILTAGCDKKFITCCNKFNNAVNFRGEPFIPDLNFLKII